MYQVLDSDPGHGIEVTFRAHWLFCFQISFAILLTSNVLGPWTLSASGGLRTQKTVPMDAKIVLAVKDGDVTMMKSLFSFKQAGPTDNTRNGHSLLHVLIPERHIFNESDMWIDRCKRNHTDVVKLLLEQGAHVGATNDSGKYGRYQRLCSHFAHISVDHA